jgi:hypothetical protein
MAFRKSKRLKFFLIFVTILLVGGVVFGIVAFTSNKPPSKIIEQGRKVLADARDHEAKIYSPKEMAAAEKYWRDAMTDWKINNTKVIVARRFDSTTKLANLAIENAIKAKANAIKRKNEIHKELEVDITNLKSNIKYIQVVLNKLPINHNIRERLTPIALKFNEAELAYQRDDLLKSKKIIEKIKVTLPELKKLTKSLVEEYFDNLPQWVKLDEEMRTWSKRNNSVSIVVDKFCRECIVYKGGKKYKSFNVELGVNWLGDKMHSGDKATPEGKYQIIAKKNGSSTIYYKSLSINFPNEEDKTRFKQEKGKGNIPNGALIGGSIAIHGGGGKGIDWTEGCVALTNKDIDALYSICSVGTPVAIVGSLLPFEKVFEELLN